MHGRVRSVVRWMPRNLLLSSHEWAKRDVFHPAMTNWGLIFLVFLFYNREKNDVGLEFWHSIAHRGRFVCLETQSGGCACA